MTYIRKTRDVWEVQQYTGSQYGWECVSAAETWKEAQEDRDAYRENQPEYPVRIRLTRERIEPIQSRNLGQDPQVTPDRQA